MLALVDALVPPPPPPPPPPPASPVRPASPSTSGPWTPRTPVGVRADSPVEEEKPDPDRCVSPLDLPPAVYSVSFTAPMRIAPDSFREYPDRLPVPFPISAEHLAQRRAQHPGAAAEIADAGNVADDEDEPDEFDL
ncbi:hypothetical protein AURDEDRAFT_169587 [Auricularia subglabra TFB-10046 SS5]|uniref:Uncharacterized protein n=1 Tax=Auricularia subglabra (strain TFB-10046 / SS5) TaxID=717982 RepID=J0WXE3_AURST|nr:hypothetical protein AURDEDRAFT_169579 [Auricularia subglabra TFB-10046 SS5]EJD41423.1 hypothetical protein AURDEDRAFT_169587 [Auricularia subglabra TFB-10046 SS5]